MKNLIAYALLSLPLAVLAAPGPSLRMDSPHGNPRFAETNLFVGVTNSAMWGGWGSWDGITGSSRGFELPFPSSAALHEVTFAFAVRFRPTTAQLSANKTPFLFGTVFCPNVRKLNDDITAGILGPGATSDDSGHFSATTSVTTVEYGPTGYAYGPTNGWQYGAYTIAGTLSAGAGCPAGFTSAATVTVTIAGATWMKTVTNGAAVMFNENFAPAQSGGTGVRNIVIAHNGALQIGVSKADFAQFYGGLAQDVSAGTTYIAPAQTNLQLCVVRLRVREASGVAVVDHYLDQIDLVSGLHGRDRTVQAADDQTRPHWLTSQTESSGQIGIYRAFFASFGGGAGSVCPADHFMVRAVSRWYSDAEIDALASGVRREWVRRGYALSWTGDSSRSVPSSYSAIDADAGSAVACLFVAGLGAAALLLMRKKKGGAA